MRGAGDEMKVVARNTMLDQQVVRYLAEPVTLKDIMAYGVKRNSDGVTVMTVEIIVDNERFEKGVEFFG